MKNLIGGAVFAVLSAGLLLLTGQIRNPHFDPLGPAFLPRFALVPMLLLSLWLILSGVRELRAAPSGDGAGNGLDLGHLRAQVLLMIELGAFIWVLNTRFVPFELAAGVFVFICGVTLIGLRDRRLLYWLCATAVVLPIAVGWVFKNLLYVSLP
ncbi:tripartite tricarboxylate transporter TctB family protein [Martelella sp. FLE1502]